MWDNWKYRENHGYGCPMLRVGAQKLLTTDDGCPMGELLGMDWAFVGQLEGQRGNAYSGTGARDRLRRAAGRCERSELSPGGMELYSPERMEREAAEIGKSPQTA